MDVTISLVSIDTPENCNLILGQSHFIKTIEDVYEAIVQSAPGIQFGVAFCEASGKRLVRSEGNNEELVKRAINEISKIGAGHSFIIFMKEGYPVNVLNAIKSVPEVCNIFAASANPLQVIVVESEQGRGILGVVDGSTPLGVETEADVVERYEFLRKIGYKL